MRLEEAAQVLGVPVDADCDTLKQAYRKRALECHPDKCKDPSSKARFQRISMAYTRLLTAHHQGEDDDDEYELAASGNPQGAYAHDPNDVKAFMRMVMELVGMFNEGQMQQVDGKYAFGVMLGDRGHMDDCSSDECDDNDLDDEDDDLEDDTLYASGMGHASHATAGGRSPSAQSAQSERDAAEAEARRREKNAKKRKKQKEKKQREQQKKEEEAREKQAQEEAAKREAEDRVRKRKEEAQRRLELIEEARQAAFAAASRGDVEGVRRVVEDPESGVRITDRMAARGKEGSTLLHAAITGGDESNTAERLAVIRYLMTCRNPSLDLAALDDQGMTILHAAAANNEVAIVQLLLEERRNNLDAKTQIELNARCEDRGWTPLHYAVSAGAADIVRLLMGEGALLNIHGGTAAGSQSNAHRVTPLELAQAQANLAAPNSRRHKALVAIVQQLEEQVNELERIKQQREAERRRKEEEELQRERERQEQKVQQEKEMLERKQRQLREKLDKEKKRAEEAEEARQRAAMLVQAAANEDASSSSKKKKKNRQKKKKDNGVEGDSNHDEENVRESTPAAKEQSQPVSQPAPASASAPAPAPAAPVVPLAVSEPIFRSRDEILEHLLAMGFSEELCYAAIQKFGYQVDAAISWLCDTPEEPSPPSKSSAASEKQSASTTQAANEGKRAVDHAEELRRINRAWNASSAQRRTEEERKEALAARKEAVPPKSPAQAPQHPQHLLQQLQHPQLQPHHQQSHLQASQQASSGASAQQPEFHPPFGNPSRYHVMPPNGPANAGAAAATNGGAAVPPPPPGMGFPMHHAPLPTFGPPGFGYPPGFHPAEQMSGFRQPGVHGYGPGPQHMAANGHMEQPNGLSWAATPTTEAWGPTVPSSPRTTGTTSNTVELSPRAQPFVPAFMQAPQQQQQPVAQEAEKPAQPQPQPQPPVLGLNLPSLVQQSQSEFVSTSLDDALPVPWDTPEFEPSSFLSMLGGGESGKSSSLFGFTDADFQTGELAAAGGSLFSGSVFAPSQGLSTSATSGLLGLNDAGNIDAVLSGFARGDAADVLDDDLPRLANLLSQAGLSEDHL